ncbi:MULTISPECIES: Y-family DNA polymerase [Prochlorococcus]|uniref:Y-family DNA polymerase n=1 Tax=Prochlorococcus TaxID=1218 RepID=UPI0005337EFD|nr:MULTISPECIES: Y-family DNA polymerase [Prochlorococcus]KGG12630.1 Error-prone [Prochlorococcus sp. MIT 0601]
MAIVLIDANNFYAACEQVFDPSLVERPLVILSNNDGCVIARNAKARQLGVLMGQPYFKIRATLERLDVAVRSSNYALYGDMSQRLMTLLKIHCEEIEVYSIDEAFGEINRPPNKNLFPWARQLRANIYQSLGLPISIGIGINKGQAKLANHLAKTITNYAGIFDLENASNKEAFFESIAIEDVWGIGKKLAHWCRIKGIHNARQLRDMPSSELKAKCGVVGIRLQKELQGYTCVPLSVYPSAKQETCVSRSFSKPITKIEELRQAIATYVVRAGEKLRKQNQYAGSITVFTRTSNYTKNFYSQSATRQLYLHSNDTAVLLRVSLDLVERIFCPYHKLIKAGVIMQNLTRNDHLQLHLLKQQKPQKYLQRERLMSVIDHLNQLYGNGTIQWAACGVSRHWEMRRQNLSPAATTRLKDIPIVNA